MREAELQILSHRILEFLGAPKTSLEIHLISEKLIRELNKKFRGKDKPTNVLSFEYPEDFPNISKKRNIGQIYLCPTYIKNHNENIDLMLVHGILHLLSFNHEKNSDRIKMEKLEKKTLSWLKIQS